MKDLMAALVYPTLRLALETNERGRAAIVDQTARFKLLLDAFDVGVPEAREFQLARAALALFISELGSPPNQPLALLANLGGLRSETGSFVDLAKTARSLDMLDALETFYWCAVLGYQSAWSGPTGLRAREEWTRITYAKIGAEAIQGFSPAAPTEPAYDARPLPKDDPLSRATLFFVGALVFAGASMGWLLHKRSEASRPRAVAPAVEFRDGLIPGSLQQA